MARNDGASAILDEMTDRLNAEIKAGKGFDNDSVMWLIRAWTKVGVMTQGPGFHGQASAYYVMKREPRPYNGKRSKALLNALENFEGLLDGGTSTGDFFRRADDSMLDFVWEYRKAVSGRTDKGKSEADLVSRLMRWRALPVDAVMKSEVTNMDRSI